MCAPSVSTALFSHVWLRVFAVLTFSKSVSSKVGLSRVGGGKKKIPGKGNGRIESGPFCRMLQPLGYKY